MSPMLASLLFCTVSWCDHGALGHVVLGRVPVVVFVIKHFHGGKSSLLHILEQVHILPG